MMNVSSSGSNNLVHSTSSMCWQVAMYRLRMCSSLPSVRALMMSLLIRGGFEVINNGYDLKVFYIARALYPGSGMTPGKVSEGAVGEMESDRTSCENDTDCFNSTQRQPHTVAKKIYIVNTKCSYTLAPRLDVKSSFFSIPKLPVPFPGDGSAEPKLLSLWSDTRMY